MSDLHLPAGRTGPELPGRTTVDWQFAWIVWALDERWRCEHGWDCAIAMYRDRLVGIAQHHRTMFGALTVRAASPTSLILAAPAMGSPN